MSREENAMMAAAARERYLLTPRQREIRSCILRRFHQIVPTVYHYFEGGEHMANLSLQIRDDEVRVMLVITDEAKCGQGRATKAMRALMECAKECGVVLRGHAKPTAHATLNLRQLVAWYRKLGFTADENDMITYSPSP